MVMMRHPLSGTEYYRNDDGTVRVAGRDGKEGIFTRVAGWISGERRTADAGLCRWVSDGNLRPQISLNRDGARPHFDRDDDAA